MYMYMYMYIYISPNSFFGLVGPPGIPWLPVSFFKQYREKCRFPGPSPTKTRHFCVPNTRKCNK